MNNIPLTINHRLSTNKGFILLLTLIFMTVLTVFTGSLIYMTTVDMKNVASQSDDVNLEGLADAGIDRAHREIKDDYTSTTSQGTADLRGADTSLSVSISSPNNMRYIDTSTATINNNADQAILRTFDSNYTNTKIISVELRARASRAGGSGSNPTIEVSYTTDGVNYTPAISATITSTTVGELTTADITGSLTWSTIMSSNFRLRAMRTAGTININLDSIYLRVTYGIDTAAESWATGSYASFPISLSGGTIQSIAITDEQRKAHLNYALQALLSNLLTNLGIASASTKATNIVNYRGVGLTNPFDSVEELQQVTGITASDYAAIKDYVTVYSFVNSNVYRPTGPRAPVNINTTSFEVLKAIFDSLTLGAGDSTTLANGIISFRNSTPFIGFYTSTSTADNRYFYNFVRNAAYLSTSGNPDEKDRVMDNADPSSLIPFSGSAAFTALTTEFCYASNVFHIEVLARFNNRDLRVKTLRGNDGSRAFGTYVGDTTLSGRRKENYE